MSYPPQAPHSQQYAPPPPPMQPVQPIKGSGLAVAALVLGIIALLLSWIPIINNLAAVLAVVGLALGIPALLQARKGRRGGKGMAIAGVVTSVVAIAVVIVTQSFYADVIDEVQNELDDLESTSQDAGSLGEPADAGTDETSTDDVVPLGTPTTVGDYEVTLDAVALDGNAIAAAGNQFNEAPTGQYVVIQVTTTYAGTEEGFPGMDLSAIFHGSDNRQYSDSECAAILPDDAINGPTLNPGGMDTFQFCMDVAPAAIAGGRLSIEETLSWDGDPVFFALA